MSKLRTNSVAIKRVQAQIPDKFKPLSPPFKSALELNGIVTAYIEWEFRKLRITTRDAFIRYELSTIRLIHLLDEETGTKRKKLKAFDYTTSQEFRGDSGFKPKTKTVVPKKFLVEEFKRLDVKREAALGGIVICKAPLVEVIRDFNSLLIASKSNRDYVSLAKRARIICLWVKWFFKEKYGIVSNYNQLQIRELIDEPDKEIAN